MQQPNNSPDSKPQVSVPLSLLTTEQKRKLGYEQVILSLVGVKITPTVRTLLEQAVESALVLDGATVIGGPSWSHPWTSGESMYLLVRRLPEERKS